MSSSTGMARSVATFAVAGKRAVLLPGIPGSIEFMAAYQAALATVSPPPPSPKHVIRGSLAEIAAGYFRSAAFANLSQSSQQLYRIALKPVLAAHGHRLVRELPKTAARNLIEAIGATRPGRANPTRAALSQVMAYAIATGVRTDNPFSGLERYRLGTHHTWTDAEIAQFERRWRLGTRERLAFALLLYTRATRRRRCEDGSQRHCQRSHTGVPGQGAQGHDKRADDPNPSCPRKGATGWPRGRNAAHHHRCPRSAAQGLTALIEKAVKLAGLPAHCVAHGLRKAALRRLAEHGSTTKEIAAVSGHRSLSEIERYTARADQARLARSAVEKLPDMRTDDE